ncbi:hypothetical protein KKA53_02590 [Candidatus Dependentiae bacterium]|nr:hypothetical protein [Candidatus Dependentiae bacterium]
MSKKACFTLLGMTLYCFMTCDSGLFSMEPVLKPWCYLKLPKEPEDQDTYPEFDDYVADVFFMLENRSCLLTFLWSLSEKIDVGINRVVGTFVPGFYIVYYNPNDDDPYGLWN